MKALRWLFYLWVLALCALGAGGCASTSDEELSQRPWNAPKSWETGLPSGMLEGR
jgi:hypothetical protein